MTTAMATLKNAGLKTTPARMLMLGLFSSAPCKPLNAEAIFAAVRPKKINQVTVYRTLASLESAGIIKRVDFRKDSAYYELAGIDHHHHHITCIKCDTIEDFHSTAVENAVGNIVRSSSKFARVEDHSLELFGICKQCS